MAHNQTATQVILPTNKQKRFAYDISNLLGYPLPKNTLGEYAKFIANHTEEYYVKRGIVLSELSRQNKEKSKIQEYVPDTNGKFVLQEVCSRLRLQNVKPRMSNTALSSIEAITDFIKKQQKPFLENVISEADYLYLLNSLKRDGYLYW